MYCPVCKDKELVMSERQGIEIDYCPQCRGVWLDRGELDKIIQHSVRDLSATQAPAANYPPAQQQYPQHSQQRHYDDERRYQHKKKSFWEDLFD
jgi:hypothetical protein